MTEGELLVEGEFGEGAFGSTILLRMRSKIGAGYLLSLFERLAGSPEGTSMKLEAQPGVSMSAALWSLDFRVVATSRAQRLFRDDAGGFIWQGTADEWETTALLVEPLTHQAGHQYLTFEVDDDALVEVSQGEGHG
jgi:hypothetical protein